MSHSEFDYVVVGGGSAGCCVAGRLSEDALQTVCLLEAGGPDDSVFVRATVAAKTINVHSFNPAMPSPFSVAIVELEEDASTRLTTNVIGCPPESVHIGMKVQVEFEHYEDVWVPVFRPVAS